MDDQYQCDQSVTKYRTTLQMTEAVSQLPLQAEVIKQGLKHYQPDEGDC